MLVPRTWIPIDIKEKQIKCKIQGGPWLSGAPGFHPVPIGQILNFKSKVVAWLLHGPSFRSNEVTWLFLGIGFKFVPIGRNSTIMFYYYDQHRCFNYIQTWTQSWWCICGELHILVASANSHSRHPAEPKWCDVFCVDCSATKWALHNWDTLYWHRLPHWCMWTLRNFCDYSMPSWSGSCLHNPYRSLFAGMGRFLNCVCQSLPCCAWPNIISTCTYIYIYTA